MDDLPATITILRGKVAGGRKVRPGEVLTVMDETGAGDISDVDARVLMAMGAAAPGGRPAASSKATGASSRRKAIAPKGEVS
jgi:hypothetical protein